MRSDGLPQPPTVFGRRRGETIADEILDVARLDGQGTLVLHLRSASKLKIGDTLTRSSDPYVVARVCGAEARRRSVGEN